MTDYYETKSQPITRVMVWQAYKEVKSNAGSGGIDGMSWEYLQNRKSSQVHVATNQGAHGIVQTTVA